MELAAHGYVLLGKTFFLPKSRQNKIGGYPTNPNNALVYKIFSQRSSEGWEVQVGYEKS